MSTKKSTKTPKESKKRYFIKDKEVITDPDAPVISNEFADFREEGVYQGQTIEVQSDTKLEEDHGTGEPYILRTFTFALSPELVNKGVPDSQDLFNAFSKGIESYLWTDGLIAVKELPPRIVFTKKKTHILIMVWAVPRLGQSVLETPKTLSEIIRESRPNTNSL